MSEQPSRYVTRTWAVWQFILMMVALFLLAMLQQQAQSRQDGVIDTQAAVVAELKSGSKIDCLAHNATTTKMNDLVDELVTSVQQGKTLPPAEQADRVARYTALKAPMQVCAR